MGIATLWPLYESGEIVPAAGIIFTTFGVMLVIVSIINLELIYILIGILMIIVGVPLYVFGLQYVRKKREEKRKQYYQWVNDYEQYMKSKYNLQSQHRSQYRAKKNYGRYKM